MKREVITESSQATVYAHNIYNSDSVGFVSEAGQEKGFISRIDYDLYKPIQIRSDTYFSKQDTSKQKATERLIGLGYQVFQFSSDSELRTWLMS